MDYLHYLQVECENFNLICSNLLINMYYTCVRNELEKRDGYKLVGDILETLAYCLLLFGFVYNIQYSAKAHKLMWKLFYTVTIILGIVAWILNYVET